MEQQRELNLYLILDEHNKVCKPDQSTTVSDLLSVHTVQSWKAGDIVLINSGTGTGKSFFLRNNVCDYFKQAGLRVLYLVNRTNLLGQFAVDGDSAITYKTYQSMESNLLYKKNLDEWDVIIADEMHYFFADADFNHTTDVSLAWILHQKKAVRIFLSATHKGMSIYLQRQKISFKEYVLPLDRIQINNLMFFDDESRFERIAQQVIDTGTKAIFFIQSLQKALNLYKKFSDHSMFLCSKCKPEYKNVNTAAQEKMLNEEHFDCNLLFTTAVLDNGVTVKDTTLKTIVVDMNNPLTIMQCVGRKRCLGADDGFDLYIRSRSSQQIGGLLAQQQKMLSEIQGFNKYGAVYYNARYKRGNDDNRLFVDVPAGKDASGHQLFKKRLNVCKYISILDNISCYTEILEHQYRFVGYVAELLKVKKYSVMRQETKIKELADYLETLIGKPMLTKKDKEPFIVSMNIRKDGKLCKSYSGIAGWIEGSGSPYRLIEHQTSRSVGGKKKNFRAWEIVKITE